MQTNDDMHTILLNRVQGRVTFLEHGATTIPEIEAEVPFVEGGGRERVPPRFAVSFLLLHPRAHIHTVGLERLPVDELPVLTAFLSGYGVRDERRRQAM